MANAWDRRTCERDDVAVNLLGATPRLVVVPAQYQGNEKRGVEQLYPRMDLVVYYADAGQTDFVAPSLWEADSVVFKGITTKGLFFHPEEHRVFLPLVMK